MENTASWVRRLVALAVDWAACSLVTLVVLGPGGYSDSPYSGWVTLGVFWLESTVGVALAGCDRWVAADGGKPRPSSPRRRFGFPGPQTSTPRFAFHGG